MPVDTRLGGEGRTFWFSTPPDWRMRIPDQIKNCVAFLGYNESPGFPYEKLVKFGGTGFFVTVVHAFHAFNYLVTARHVADKLAEYADPVVRLNARDGSAFCVSLQGTKWYYHPTDITDVAVCEFKPPINIMAAVIPEGMLLAPEQIGEHGIGIGDEVFAVGLFHFARGAQSNSPIARIGNIAMLPTDRLKTEQYGEIDAYLIEARSLGGLSGSPVFVRETVNYPVRSSNPGLPEKFIQTSGDTYLLGLAHGHWDIDESDLNNPVPSSPREAERGGVNIGIAVVVPAEKIRETLYQPVLVNARAAAIKPQEPTPDGR